MKNVKNQVMGGFLQLLASLTYIFVDIHGPQQMIFKDFGDSLAPRG